MNVRVNGADTEINEGATLERLLAMLNIGTQGSAVEINREIVPRRLHGTTMLREGDRIEIVRMTGGG
ncbi:MAG: sulfur carrier protein ThiS [Deltaproteobacteria bacterium]|nr:sulfur carrier protein ThiS [Deltaproteobacteria bacterium]